MVLQSNLYYIQWLSNNLSGSFSIGGNEYDFSDYPDGYFSDFSGIITSRAFLSNSQFWSVQTNATEVQEEAFKDCTALRSFLGACDTVCDRAFMSCYSLRSMVLTECTSIGEQAFAYCSSLGNGNVSVPKVKYIDDSAFMSTALRSLTLKECEYIGSYVFRSCSSFSNITVSTSFICTLNNSNAMEGTKITPSTGFIYVPVSLLADYKVAPEWSYFWPRIFPIGYVSYLYSKFSSSTAQSSYYITWIEKWGTPGSIHKQNVPSVVSADRRTGDGEVDNVWYYVGAPFTYFETNIPYINWTWGDGGKASPGSKYSNYDSSNTRQYFNGAYYGTYSVGTIRSVYFPECSYMSPFHMGYLVNLEYASFPALEFVPPAGFGSCWALPSIDLPACSSIFSYAFRDCSSLTAITLRRPSVCYLEDSNAFIRTPIASGSGSIYVPSSLVSAYKTQPYWSYFSTQIFPIPE